MLNRDIREKREELRKKSATLRDLSFETEDIPKQQEIRNKQDELYKRWKFYDFLIKSTEKLKEGETSASKNR